MENLDLQDVVSLPDGDAEPQSGAEERNEAEVEKPEGSEAAAKPEADEKPETAEDEGNEDDSDSEDEKPRKESRSARLRRQLAALRAENEELKRSPKADAGKSGEAKGDEDPAPKFEDFNGDWDAYDAARIKHAAREVLRADRAESAKRESESRRAEVHAELVEEFEAGRAKARKAIPDFDEVLTKAREAGIKAERHVAELILESEKGPLLSYHFAQKPELLNELNSMSEREAARRIGRLEARLSLPTPKKATNAPAPADSPKGGAAPSSPEADLEAWLSKKYGSNRR